MWCKVTKGVVSSHRGIGGEEDRGEVGEGGEVEGEKMRVVKRGDGGAGESGAELVGRKEDRECGRRTGWRNERGVKQRSVVRHKSEVSMQRGSGQLSD